MKQAFAYVDHHGDIDIATVSATEQAVMVNMIVVGSNRHVIPAANATLEEIEAMFINITGGLGDVKPVSVAVIEE